MRCDQLESRLNELLDSRHGVDEDAAVNAHASGCPRCAQLLRGYQMLADTYGPDDEPAAVLAGDTFGPQVVLAFQQRRWQRWLRFSLVAVAATLLLSTLVTLRGPRGDSSRVGGGSAVADASGVTAVDMHLVFLSTGRQIVTLPDAFRRVAAMPEADLIATRMRPVTLPVTVALRAIRDVWPDSYQYGPRASETGRIAIAEGNLIA